MKILCYFRVRPDLLSSINNLMIMEKQGFEAVFNYQQSSIFSFKYPANTMQYKTKQNPFLPVLNLNTIKQKFHCSVPLQLLNGFIDYRSYNSLASTPPSHNSKLFGLES